MTIPEIKAVVEDCDGVSVRGFLHLPENPSGNGLALTHGAGANCQSLLLTSIANAFADRGLTVLRFDLPFRQLRPHGPPPRGSAERDQHGIRAAVAVLRQQVSGRIFLGGHSYGGRQASILASSDPALVDALLLLAYPLHPPKRREELRTAHFPALRTPAMFVSGTRDGFGTIDELTTALQLIPATTELQSIQSAGHELISNKNCEELPILVTDSFLSFVNRVL